MEPWRCASCDCEYCWSEPEIIKGHKLCVNCADDPNKVEKFSAETPLSIGYWRFLCFLCFLAGVMIGTILSK